MKWNIVVFTFWKINWNLLKMSEKLCSSSVVQVKDYLNENVISFNSIPASFTIYKCEKCLVNYLLWYLYEVWSDRRPKSRGVEENRFVKEKLLFMPFNFWDMYRLNDGYASAYTCPNVFHSYASLSSIGPAGLRRFLFVWQHLVLPGSSQLLCITTQINRKWSGQGNEQASLGHHHTLFLAPSC